jgi:predicted RNase H-like HicB family nuclease
VAKFTIVYNAEERGYSGKCLEIPGVISEGETLGDLKDNMIDAITLATKSMDMEAQEAGRMFIEIPD